MNLLSKFIFAILFATSLAVLVGLLSVIVLSFIVNLFKLNNGRDAYWSLSVSFFIVIISWIFFFGLYMSEEKTNPEQQPVGISFEEHAKNCQQCGRPEITEDGPQSLCEEGFRIFQREIIQKMEKKK
jgi:hypothetical protein